MFAASTVHFDVNIVLHAALVALLLLFCVDKPVLTRTSVGKVPVGVAYFGGEIRFLFASPRSLVCSCIHGVDVQLRGSVDKSTLSGITCSRSMELPVAGI